MSFDNLHIKDNSDLWAFCPKNLSHNLVTGIESTISNRPVESLSTFAPNLFIWITFGGMIGWIILEIVQELGTVKLDKKLVLSFTPKKCLSCQFYAKNSYLQCAVHPSIVLTKQADNCQDYCSKHE